MNKGRATRIYSIDRDKVKEAVESIEKEIAEMTEQNRLLTPEMIGYIVLSVAVEDQWCFRGDTLKDNLPSYQAITKAQDTQTREMTLNEVGAYLDRGWLDEKEGYRLVHTSFIEALKQGKLPEGG